MRSGDGWCALTLSREDDVDAVPALLESDAVGDDPWPAVKQWVAEKPCRRRHCAGAPARSSGSRPRRNSSRATADHDAGRSGAAPRGPSGLLVADLSSMWAGPLCGQLLARAGATVVKVESRSQARRHPRRAAGVLRLDEQRKALVRSRFRRASGPARLLEAADVVIESSRPAALAHRGLGPADIPRRDGRVWLRITGHGTDGERANWVAFGDDAAVSGGLVGGSDGEPVFCGDAIADPLTGLHAALDVAESLSRGGGELIELSMAAVAATYANDDRTTETRCARNAGAFRRRRLGLGADNAAVERLLAERRLASC